MLRKQAILLAATEHFGRFGFRGASLRDIARSAGVSLTLLNHHFGSKAQLLEELLSYTQQFDVPTDSPTGLGRLTQFVGGGS